MYVHTCSSLEDVFIDSEREEGGERDWASDVRVASRTCPHWDQTRNPGMCSDWESNPQPFWCTGQCSNQLSHPARASFRLLHLQILQTKATKISFSSNPLHPVPMRVFGSCHLFFTFWHSRIFYCKKNSVFTDKQRVFHYLVCTHTHTHSTAALGAVSTTQLIHNF